MLLLSIFQYKTGKATEKTSTILSEQSNELAKIRNEIANYSANVMLDGDLSMDFNTRKGEQHIFLEDGHSFSTINIKGKFITRFGEISKIGAIEVINHGGKPSLALDKMTLNHRPASETSNPFEFSITFESNEPGVPMLRSHAYIWVLDSNFNLSIQLIELVVDSLVFTEADKKSGRGRIHMTTNPIDGRLPNVNYCYRYFSSFDLLAYNATSKQKKWTGPLADTLGKQEKETSISKSLQKLLSDNNDIDQEQLVKEIAEIRKFIKTIVG
jgi:hypothetical protein